MKLLQPVTTPYGQGIIGGRSTDKDNNTKEWLVSIKRKDYQRNYPRVPTCDGPCINILVPVDQVEEIQ